MPTTSSAAMALAHACPLHPTAILDSLSKLHRRRLSFLRHAHPIAQRSIGNLHTTPARRKSSRSCCSNSRFYGSISPDSGWIDKWSQNRTRESSMRLQAVVDYRGSGVSDDEDEVGTSRSTGASTMARIVEKLKKFGYVDDAPAEKPRLLPEKGSVEDIFYAEDGVLPNARGGLLSELGEDEVVRFPWEKPPDSDEDEDGGGATPRKKRSKTSLAELTLPETELRRLRHLAIRTKSRTKIGGAGVTKEIVDKIHEKWQTEEVVRLKCEGPPALNMKRMHEILERKTGGLVIWRSGSSISLYRGVTYVNSEMERHRWNTERSKAGSSNNTHNDKLLQISTAGLETRKGNASHEMTPRAIEPLKEVNYESEVDKLLDGLGPRYTDWSGFDPLPVDADLLPGVVPGYKPPFRVLPYGVRPHLGVKDQTALRRLARVLPPHFALGRSRQHQGLAAAIVKLWEKSLIAKVALKRGVQLTSSERMAEEIKRLTGGSLLCRNKEYIVFYRGKDFLAPEVANALLERERLAKTLEEEEEQAKQRASSSISLNLGTFEDAGTTGTLKETLEANARWGKQLSENAKDELVKAAELERHGVLVRKLERQLSMAERKMMKAEKGLAQVEEFLKPSETGSVHESITDEERYMFRKLGLKMKAYLLLGRRGVFDGTVENMHLHWKYRELVKIIVKAKTFAQVKNVALALEAESGGILVSVDKISKGFAIIVFRGKDYRRPTSLRPKNLLTKRKALARSIELQRREALQHHISNLQTKVERLRKELDQMETVKKHGNEELYAKLDVAYPSEDDETEEDDDTYPEIAKNVLNSDKAWSYYTHNEEAGDYDDDAGDYDVDDDDGVTAAYDGSSDDDGGGIDNSDVKSHVNSDMSESSMFELESERTANYLHQYRDL